MAKTLKDIITEFNSTGDCKVDVDLVVNKWNHTWGIYQWNDQYRLIKHVRLGSPNTRIKVKISPTQATEIIDRLQLDSESGGFKSSKTWRNIEDYYEKLTEFNSKRN